jgi:redox-sensitive bicupin YhaK (pirin superfamily)
MFVKDTNLSAREVTKVVTAHRQREGGGFIVRRPLPTRGLEMVDPILLIDEMGPVDYAPGEAIGAPDHPHRGFETVTYVLEGEMEHEDSAGHRGFLGAGDVQWMTAGAGIVHSEMPSRRMREQGGRVHGFQVWVNLPARLKMTRPRYQEISAARIPRTQSSDGRARVSVIAGEALGVRAVIDTHTPIVFQDWSIGSGADVSVPLPKDHDALAYVFEGALQIGDQSKVVREGQLAVLGPGDTVRLRGLGEGNEPGRMLLLAGVPIREPVAHHGPFVMSSDQELLQAMRDYQSGRMGEITRTAKLN